MQDPITVDELRQLDEAVLAAVRAGNNRFDRIAVAVAATLGMRGRVVPQRDLDRSLQRLRTAGKVRYHKVNEGGTGWEPLTT